MVLFSLEKAEVGFYCCVQLPSGECRKHGPRLIFEEQQLKDKRQWTQIAMREILVRYDEMVFHHKGIQTLGQGPRGNMGSPPLEAFKM